MTRTNEAKPQPETAGEEGALVLPVDTPLTALFDAETGTLRIEAPLLRGGGGRVGRMLQLNFSAEAASAFARMLNVVEDEHGVIMTCGPRTTAH